MNEMDRLLAALREVKDDVDFAAETALIDDGLIDSLDLTQILLALGEAFDVHLPAGEIEPENFNDVDAMLALVHRYQAR